MSDLSTLQDQVEDLMQERTRLYERFRAMSEECDKWRIIAGMLVNGAERQIDDLRGSEKVDNTFWLAAWNAYHREIRHDKPE